MTDKYFTTCLSALAGFDLGLEYDWPEDRIVGVSKGKVRCYYDVAFADIVSHDDEDALMFVRPGHSYLIVVMAPADKALPMKEVCDARGVACHYEIRGGRTIFRAAYQEGLDAELASLFNEDDKSANDEVVFHGATSKSGDESDNENGLEPGSGSGENSKLDLDFGDLSAFPD